MSPRPVIHSIIPDWSPIGGGQLVQIFGDGFDYVSGFDQLSSVTFGLYPASIFTLPGANFIQATTPSQAQTGFVPVVVTDSLGQQSAPYTNFKYVLPLPPWAVNVRAPVGGEVFLAGQPITVRWTTTVQAYRHEVRLSTPSRTIVLNNRLPGTARTFTFSHITLIPIQVTVQVYSYDFRNQSASASSQPFTIRPSVKNKEKEKEKEHKEVLADKEKELWEGPR